MVSVHYNTSEERKIWSHIGLVFATIYAVLISINYYVQLTFVVPRLLQGDVDSISLQPFLFVPFDSFLYSVDILGYSFMSLATLFAAFAFTGKGIERTVRWFMIANGLLLPFLALQIYYHPLIWIAALWAITFPGVTISRGLVSTKFGQIAEPTVALAYPSLSHLSSNSSVADGFNRAAAVVTTVEPGHRTLSRGARAPRRSRQIRECPRLFRRQSTSRHRRHRTA